MQSEWINLRGCEHEISSLEDRINNIDLILSELIDRVGVLEGKEHRNEDVISAPKYQLDKVAPITKILN